MLHKIIMTFPGCGKSYMAENQYKYGKDGLRIIDLDSSKFRKYKGWEKHYVDVIEEIVEEDRYDYILVNEYEIVMEIMKARGIPFTAVIPHSDDPDMNQRIKEMMFGRFVLRGKNNVRDPEKWMAAMIKNYDKWADPRYVSHYTADIAYIDISHPFLPEAIGLIPNHGQDN